MNTTSKMYGFLWFDHGLIIDSDLLGKTFDAIIAGVNCKVHFPCKKEPFNYDCLDCPKILVGFQNEVGWGSFLQYKKDAKSCCNIAYCALEILSDIYEDAQTVYRNIGEWQCNLMNYTIAITKQNMYPSVMACSDTNLARLQLYYDGNRIKKNSDINVITMNINVQDWCEEALTAEQLNFVLNKLGNGKKLNDEYNILLDAYYNLSTGDRKAAVLYGGLAVEAVIAQRLKYLDPTKDISKHTLGKLFNELLKLEKLPSSDWKTKIVDVRNDVIHGNIKNIINLNVSLFLYEVEIYLRWAYPNEII